MTDILALDIATTTGWARGRVGERPKAGSIRFGKPEASANAVFAHCLSWLSNTLEPQPRPDIIVVESMLSPEAKVGNTSRDVRDRLAGLHGIVRAVAFLRGVYTVNEAGVGQVRAHFIGASNLKRAIAKREVVDTCCRLGWLSAATDDNAADALALWSYAVALIDPEQGLKLSPLFNQKLRAAS
jgi:hypothetical protein